MPHGGLFDFLPLEDEIARKADNDAVETAKMAMSMQLHSSANYDSDKFYALFKKLSDGADRGFDGKIRFPMLKIEELRAGTLAQQVKKSEVGPLLLAINAQNAKAVRDLLAADKGVNLRESLRGPKEIHGLLSSDHWMYTFNNIGGSEDSLSMPF